MNKNNLSLSILLVIITNVIFAQDTINVKEVLEKDGKSTVIYHVQDSNNKIRQGKFSYTYDGVLLMEGFYANNLMNGIWKYYLPSGKLRSRVVFVNDVCVNNLESYYEDGKPEVSLELKGKRTTVKNFSSSSELTKEAFFFGENWIRTVYYFPKSGKPRILIVRYPQDSSLTEITQYYENGNIRSVILNRYGRPFKGTGCFDVNGKSLDQGNLSEGTGVLKSYQDTAAVVLASEEIFKDRKRNGLATYYQSNGLPGRKGVFKDDKEVELWVYWDKNGHKDFEIHFDRPNVVLSKAIPVLPADLPPLDYYKTAPEFPGKDKDQELLYSSNLRFGSLGERGRVVLLNFAVNLDGTIEDVSMYNGITGVFNIELVRVTKLMPRWIPYFENGIPVRVQYRLRLSVRT